MVKIAFLLAELTFCRPDGEIFAVGCESILPLHRPCVVGDVVTFTYDRQARRNVPTNPRVTRIREDMSWQDLLQTYGNSM